MLGAVPRIAGAPKLAFAMCGNRSWRHSEECVTPRPLTHVRTRTHNTVFVHLLPEGSCANEEVVFVASRCPEQP